MQVSGDGYSTRSRGDLPNKRREKEEWRYVPLNSVSRAVFKELKERNPEPPWIFVNSKGDKQRSHRDWFEPAVKLAALKDYTWHNNRHIFASRLVMAGVDLRTRQNAVERLVNNSVRPPESQKRKSAKSIVSQVPC